MITNIDVTFKLGNGRLKATLIRNGFEIHNQEIKTFGRITFNDAQKGDKIIIDGICTGTAIVTIDSKTNPATPKNYPAGDFFDRFNLL